MTPGDLYRTCRTSAWRLEVLQHYEVPDDRERQQAFHEGRPLPAPRQSKLDDLQLITELRRSGRDIGRVHVITWPLSDYVRYELAAYSENVTAGENVRIADASRHPDLLALTTDFALFDGETDAPQLVLFDYEPSGRITGYRHVQDAATIAPYQGRFRLAFERSVPLEEFTGNRSSLR